MNAHALRLLSVLSLFTGAANAPPATTLRERYGLKPPTAIDPHRTALVLVDFQEEFFSGGLPLEDAPAAVANAQRLLSWARASGLHVVHVHNVAAKGSPLFAEGSPGAAVRPEVAPLPSEEVVIKKIAGGFSRTDLHERLKALGVETIIVSGLMTHLAVDTTVRDGLVLGYRVLLPSDASATRDLPGAAGGAPISARALHAASLAALADRFADVLPTRAIVALPVQASGVQ
ncbi:cysteine hydrolase [Pyxidicoccus parkwayensis]|uniref:Cysteine hydrolase n=1 Tax=Pyxidicoccus parkwayensis TaxID=2813578 RepID=A0ABX7NIU5_9BACT|nr:cysteine hydrolase family protein [Pyxidicoccus parkwaysis]QSQ18761.1 cysteine hydrolase [Pyxidicoccus parkwaysis]